MLRRLDRLFGTRNWTLQQASHLGSEARTHFDHALQIAPEESDVLLEIGRTFLLSGRRKEAAKWFDRAVAADETSGPARLERVLLSLEEAVSHAPSYDDLLRGRSERDDAAQTPAIQRENAFRAFLHEVLIARQFLVCHVSPLASFASSPSSSGSEPRITAETRINGSSRSSIRKTFIPLSRS